MKIKKSCFLFALFLPRFLWAEIQYKPLSSPERHDISSGWAFAAGKNKHNGFFLSYALYFPEITDLFTDSAYKKIFMPGLSLGLSSLKVPEEKTSDPSKAPEEKICGPKVRFLPLSLGLKVRIPYFELIQPFGELGWTLSSCHDEDVFSKISAKEISSKIRKSQKKFEIRGFEYYLSYGFLLSLKILDKGGIYSLDQDYGINDFGLRADCIHYYPESETSLPFCRLAVQFSF